MELSELENESLNMVGIANILPTFGMALVVKGSILFLIN